MRLLETHLRSWGGNSASRMTLVRPERSGAVAEAFAVARQGGLIAVGASRNYGDISLCEGGLGVDMQRLNRILDFDAEAGIVAVEPGITFETLHEFSARRGFLLPVIPGTGQATLGGGVASDVHGKNHDRHGSLGCHIEWLDVLCADGRIYRASPGQNADLYAATIGGIGLTGIIVGIAIRLMRLKANAVEVTEMRVENLDAFLDLLFEYRETATYTVGWIDALQRGAAMGRGIFQAGEPVDAARSDRKPVRIGIPVRLPDRTLNRVSVAAFNELYFRRVPQRGRKRIMGFRAFHNPLDAIADWNRLYGRRGFYQFQCVVPDEAAREGLRRILTEVSEARAASFLGVIKTFGSEGPGYLSFPMRGVTISLDLPACDSTRGLMERLEAITLDHAGRIYLAKDATLSARGFAQMYPELPAFRAVLRKFDPDGIFASNASRRLSIRAEA